MTQTKPTVLVLWGNYFDEYVATAFVCELRAAGVRVRIVGIDGRLARGRYGMMLGTELSLERVLAVQQPITHVIAPCSGPQWRALLDNAQAARLLRHLRQAGGVFVIPGETTPSAATHEGSDSGTDSSLPLPALQTCSQGATEIARRLAKELVG